MPPFRPANLNKRAYPGNASVIGPTCTATVGFTTTTCCTSTASCGACIVQPLCLGCRCSFCACPCCNIVCGCPCTVCDRTIPSGRWKASEQYEAATRLAWGDDTCSCGGATCLCCTNVGFACTGAATDYKGFFICCGPTTNKWFVAASCSVINRTSSLKNDAVTQTNSLLGACGWFIPSCCQFLNPTHNCRGYADWSCGSYWHSTDNNSSFHINQGCFHTEYLGGSKAIRTIRCTAT